MLNVIYLYWFHNDTLQKNNSPNGQWSFQRPLNKWIEVWSYLLLSKTFLGHISCNRNNTEHILQLHIPHSIMLIYRRFTSCFKSTYLCKLYLCSNVGQARLNSIDIINICIDSTMIHYRKITHQMVNGHSNDPWINE